MQQLSAERKPLRTYCEDARSPAPGMLEVHQTLRSEHGLWEKSEEDHVGEARARWQSAFASSWGSELQGGTTNPEFNANASFTRWLAPTLNPTRVEERKGGCRNAWQQQAWVDEARASWRDKNPKDSWYSSADPLPRLAPHQIQESGSPVRDTFEAFALECGSPSVTANKARVDIHGARMWG